MTRKIFRRCVLVAAHVEQTTNVRLQARTYWQTTNVRLQARTYWHTLFFGRALDGRHRVCKLATPSSCHYVRSSFPTPRLTHALLLVALSSESKK